MRARSVRGLCLVVSLSIGMIGGDVGSAQFQSPLVIQPVPSNESFGFGLALGDVNGDGSNDLVVGAVLSDVEGRANAGQAFVYFGGASWDASADLTLTAPTLERDARFGWAIALGDVNGDGHKDIVVSAPFANGGAQQGRGGVYVYFGGPSVDAQADVVLALPTVNPLAHFGWALAVGDVTGDGWADILVGAENAKIGAADQAGRVFLYAGGPSFSGAITETLQASVPQRGAAFGYSLAVGDVTGDGFGDLLIGAPNEDVGSAQNAGRAHLFFGGPSFDAVADAALQQATPVPKSGFGQTIAIGDVSGDGFADILIGVPHPNLRQTLLSAQSDPGEVQIFLGGRPLDFTADLTVRAPSPTRNDNFGGALALGDALGDESADLLVGSVAVGNQVVGSAYLFRGGSGMDAQADATFRPSPPDPNAQFSVALAIGDVNGDGRGDVVIGSIKPGTLGLGGGPGKVYVFLAS